METFFRSPLLIAFLNFKRSVVRINSDDNLYCARATVTTTAHLHKDDGVDEMRLYENLRRGLPVQGTRARALLQEAEVPEGPCGMCKLDTFQKALSPAYQICVLSVDKPHMIIFKGPPADKKILPIQTDAHFQGFWTNLINVWNAIKDITLIIFIIILVKARNVWRAIKSFAPTLIFSRWKTFANTFAMSSCILWRWLLSVSNDSTQSR